MTTDGDWEISLPSIPLGILLQAPLLSTGNIQSFSLLLSEQLVGAVYDSAVYAILKNSDRIF